MNPSVRFETYTIPRRPSCAWKRGSSVRNSVSLPFASPLEPELPPDPVGRDPLRVAEEPRAQRQGDQPSCVTVVNLEGGRSLDDQARRGEHGILDEPGLELPLPKQLAGERDRQHVAALEHRRIAARVSAQRDDAVGSGQRETPRTVRCEHDDLVPGRVRERAFPDVPEDHGRRAVDIGRQEGDAPRLRVGPLRPERPFADVSADVGQPERAPAGGDHAGDAAAGARADEAVARNPLVAADGDVPEPDFVAALPVFVRVGGLGARDARGRDGPGHRPLAHRRRGLQPARARGRRMNRRSRRMLRS